MAETFSYCEYVRDLPPDDLHRRYHDEEYGFPIHNDDGLFGRLLLEINQAGLSWTTILKKKRGFKEAYEGFSIEKIAAYGEAEKERLLHDPGIIRNRLKVEAAIYNAGRILELQKEFGSFENWLDEHHSKSREEWVKIFKKEFRFTGGEIVNEFLTSTGYLPGSHASGCPIYEVWKAASPKCLQT